MSIIKIRTDGFSTVETGKDVQSIKCEIKILNKQYNPQSSADLTPLNQKKAIRISAI